MFSTSTSEIVTGLTRIPNPFLHQGTHLVRSFSGAAVPPIVIDNRNTHQGKLLLDFTAIVKQNLSYILNSVGLESLVGFRHTDIGDMGQTTWFTFKTFYCVQRARRLLSRFCSQ